ncbi:MAG: aminopeptidase [Bacteroidales bacterium]|nr:aminopeptidase [Bacteroidales bacterium]
MSKIARFFTLFGLIVLMLLLANCKLVGYAITQGIGQFKMVKNAVPIDELLQDEEYPDSLKQKLILIKEIRRFAIDSLKLNDSKNYTAVYDLKGAPTAYVVQACEKYAMKKYLWKFPVVGKLPYKGFFDEKDAEKEAQKLQQLGYDTRIVNPGGWSTMGWFKDPVLSSMLRRDEANLAELIIHELTHSTIFVKDNSELNENIADYVGENGAKYYLKSKYGDSSKALIRYSFLISDNEKLAMHYLYGAKKIDSIYNSQNFIALTDTTIKNNIKRQAINDIFESVDTLGFDLIDANKVKQYQNRNVNNTFFTGYMTYYNKKDILRNECREKFNNNFLQHLEYLKNSYPK